MDIRTQFLKVMRVELAKYPWAAEPGRLDRTMDSVEGTMNGDRRCVIDGASWIAAWKAIGQKRKPTYKAIHTLFAQEPTSPAVRCDRCAALMIQGVFCHETGCPNTHSRFDAESGEWVKQRKCFECGCTVDVTDLCCNAQDSDFHLADAECGLEVEEDGFYEHEDTQDEIDELYDEDEEDSSLSASDIRDFNGYLANCTDRQVQGVHEKESAAHRSAYVALAEAEAGRRGISL